MVGGVPTPLKNMISSVGVIIPKYIESHKIHVPNHQPDDDDDYYPIILMIIIPLHGSYGLCIYIYILQLCRWNPAESSLFGNTESESKSSIPAITGCIQAWVYQTQHKPW